MGACMMRIISHDGTMDMPYEHAVVVITEHNELFSIRASIGDVYEPMAMYETFFQAEREMKRLRDEYVRDEGPKVFRFRTPSMA